MRKAMDGGSAHGMGVASIGRELGGACTCRNRDPSCIASEVLAATLCLCFLVLSLDLILVDPPRLHPMWV